MKKSSQQVRYRWLSSISVVGICIVQWSFTSWLFYRSPDAAALPVAWRVGMSAFIGFFPAALVFVVWSLSHDEYNQEKAK